MNRKNLKKKKCLEWKLQWMVKCTIGFFETPWNSQAASWSSWNLQDLITFMRTPGTQNLVTIWWMSTGIFDSKHQMGLIYQKCIHLIDTNCFPGSLSQSESPRWSQYMYIYIITPIFFSGGGWFKSRIAESSRVTRLALRDCLGVLKFGCCFKTPCCWDVNPQRRWDMSHESFWSNCKRCFFHWVLLTVNPNFHGLKICEIGWLGYSAFTMKFQWIMH
jgi:hypothetical protein